MVSRAKVGDSSIAVHRLSRAKVSPTAGRDDATMKCPCCGAAELIRDTRDVPYTYKGQTTTIPAVTGDFCPACNESITGLAETERVMRAMRAFSAQVDASQRGLP